MAASFPPPGACDAHVHVIGPKASFPLPRERAYTPMDATTADLAAMLKRLGMQRVVLVQPSFYRFDNSCMLDAMAALPQARGVAVLPPKISDDELDTLDEQGVRGLRVNIASTGNPPIEAIKAEIAAAASLCERHGWHVQMFVTAATVEALAPFVAGLPVHTVFDHFGLIEPGTTGGALKALCKLLEGGKTWVKISGAYRIAADPNDARIAPLARALCAANRERIVWGSDWPHTPRHDMQKPGEEETPFQPVDTRGLLDLVPRWLEDDALVKRVLVDNPAKLYDF
jgi:predicted TIM-barrel fold metal-dependent hydrolase